MFARVLASLCLASIAVLPYDGPQSQTLQVPLLVESEQWRRGNPLAAYAALVDLEDRYRASPQFADIYVQVRLMTEEFLGVPDAGLRAMSSIGQLRRTFPAGETPIPSEYAAENALDVIVREAARTRLVVWGEEHHLPQTRCLYEPMLRALWKLGYRFLAAETFDESVMASDFRFPTFTSGVYLRDPVYADAVRLARDLGYVLIPYEESAAPPSGDASFRDRRQAERLRDRVFARDPGAKVLVLAGRGHASEATAAGGWTPMASVLKRITGIDPFTVFAVRMGERKTSEEEDPQYRFATAHGLVEGPTIFTTRSTRRPLGDESFDAFVFWPRMRIVDGRPDWLVSVLGRRPTAIPPALRNGSGLRLVQAFRRDEPPTAIAVDQVLLAATADRPKLMLPAGSFWLRTIDRPGRVLAEARIAVSARRR